jgi:hypothetical protein
MRQVCVHLDHDVGTAGQGPGHAGDVGAPQPVLRGPVQDLDAPRRFRGQLLRQLTCAVRGVVVDNQDPQAGQWQRQQLANELGQVVLLVVGGNDDGNSVVGQLRHVRWPLGMLKRQAINPTRYGAWMTWPPGRVVFACG